MKARILKQCLIIVALSLTGTSYSIFSGMAPPPWAAPGLEAREIRAVDANALDPIWADARSLKDYEQSHIPGAVFFDEGAWDDSLVDLMNLWLTEPRPIVVYCGSESCGTSRRVAARLLEALPDAEIYSLKGGWDAWQP